MRINSQLKIISFLTTVALSIMIPVLIIWAFLEFNQTKSNYLLEQLDTQKAEIEVLLHPGKSQLFDEADQKIMTILPERILKTRKIFRRIVINHERMSISDSDQRLVYAEFGKRLISQLLLKTSEIEQMLHNLLNKATIRIQSAYENLVIITTLFTTLLAITIIVVMTQLGRMISRRLVTLHDGAKMVAGGNLKFRIQEQGKDEFSDLAQAINFMTGNLQLFTQQIDNIMDIVRIEQDQLKVTLEDLRVSHTINESLPLVQMQADSKGIELIVASTNLSIIAD
jgi:methyl-accepting chemotaxis protein